MRPSLQPSLNSFPQTFELQGLSRLVCGSAWGLIADRLATPVSPARSATMPTAPTGRRETADQSSFSMSGFG